MKYIIVALSGASDTPVEEIGSKTPLELAKIPNLHALAKKGKMGQVKLWGDHYGSFPDVTLLNLLGYEADKVYPGRGPLEAANLELNLESNEIPFRMNFVTEFEGKLADPEAGKISSKEAKALINFLNKKVASDFVRFFAGAGYRHVVVIKDSHGFDALSAKTECPHDIMGEPVESHFPKGPGGELMKKLMCDAKLLLQDHEINQVRLDLRENPANMIWVWGQGRKHEISKFKDLFGLSGALISDAEYAKGLARLTGLTVVDLHSDFKDLAENYEEKAKAVFEALKEKDVAILHLRECDDAGRRGDFRGKVSALESADFFIISKIKDYLQAHSSDTRVLITSCHALPWQTRQRSRELVPFIMAGKGISASGSEKFTELAAKASEAKVEKSKELAQQFFAV